MKAIALAGGATVVQAPEDAGCSSMPKSVLERVAVDRIVPAAGLARALVALVGAGTAGARSGKHASATTGS